MNCDIPFIRCWVRTELISKLKGMEEAYAFGIQSIQGRALGFHCMLQSGAHYRNVPIHAVALDRDATPRELKDCQLWDCFSCRPTVHVFQYLMDHEGICYTRAGPISGTYLFTVDWLPETPERPGWTLRTEQNKCAHVMALEDGNLAALPTNRIAWKDAYFIGANPDPKSRQYIVQEDIWQAEDSGFDVSKTNEYHY